MGNFDLSPQRKFYAYFGLDRRILHMVVINILKVDKSTKIPLNSVIQSYYTQRCNSKEKNVAIGAIMHKICTIIFAMFRDNKPFEMITPQEHCKHYAAQHSAKTDKATLKAIYHKIVEFPSRRAY